MLFDLANFDYPDKPDDPNRILELLTDLRNASDSTVEVPSLGSGAIIDVLVSRYPLIEVSQETRRAGIPCLTVERSRYLALSGFAFQGSTV